MAHVRWLFQVFIHSFIRMSNVKDECCVSPRASLEAPPSRPQIVDQRPSSRGHQPLDLGTLDPLGLEMVPTAGNAPSSTSKGGPSCGVSGPLRPPRRGYLGAGLDCLGSGVFLAISWRATRSRYWYLERPKAPSASASAGAPAPGQAPVQARTRRRRAWWLTGWLTARLPCGVETRLGSGLGSDLDCPCRRINVSGDTRVQSVGRSPRESDVFFCCHLGCVFSLFRPPGPVQFHP